MTITRVRAWLGLLLITALLGGCGGGSSETMAQIRLLNASPDVGSANLYTDDDQRAAGVSPDAVSGYAELDPDDYEVKVTDSIGVTLATATQDLDKETRYTAVIYGRSGATKLAMLTEADDDTDDLDGGWSRLRVLNAAAAEAGELDIYLVPTSADASDLSGFTPVMTSTKAEVTAYSELLAGTYRMVVTGAGNSDDRRLDLPSFTLGDERVQTLVLEPGSSGVLVHALLLEHQGGLVVSKNPSARVRVIASVPAKGIVTGSVAGVTAPLETGLVSPEIGAYRLVPAGGAAVTVTANGATATPINSVNFASGADYSLLVVGPPATPRYKTILDDNRLPTNTTKAKIRLINGASSLTTAAALTVDTSSVGTPVGAPGETAYAMVTANATATVRVSAGTVTLPMVNTDDGDTPLAAGGVYTTFALDGETAANARTRAER